MKSYKLQLPILFGKHPTKLGTLASRISKKEVVATVIGKFQNHSSIISVKNEFRPTKY